MHLSFILKHSDTKRDFKNHSRSKLGWGASLLRSRLDPPLQHHVQDILFEVKLKLLSSLAIFQDINTRYVIADSDYSSSRTDTDANLLIESCPFWIELLLFSSVSIFGRWAGRQPTLDLQVSKILTNLNESCTIRESIDLSRKSC